MDAAAAASALPGLEALVDAGLAAELAGQVQPLVRVVPHDDLLLVSDGEQAAGLADRVPGVHRPSATLAHLTVRRPVAVALDIGTGLGVQALLLARHAGRVVATDVNERALGFAAFNAALNGVRTVEFRLGSFTEPVAGERFELAVCNPPYVISPVHELVYRDGPAGGDEVSEHVVRSLPGVLAEGGVATVLVSWVVADLEEPGAEPRAWLAAAGCDGLLFCTAVEDALTAAASWNREHRLEPDRFAARVDAWADGYRAEGIGHIAYGALVLRRRRRGPCWWRELALPAALARPAAADLEALLRAEDTLAGRTGRQLLDTRLTIAEGTRLELEHVRVGDGWRLSGGTLESGGNLSLGARLDASALALLRALDGSRSLREALLVATGAPAESVHLDGAATLAEKLVRLTLVRVVG